MKEIKLTDKGLTLRPFTPEDAKEHLAGEDEEMVKWFEGRSTLDSVHHWIEKNRKHWENDGPAYNFAIFDVGRGLVGMVEANTDHTTVSGVQQGDANISYSVHARFRGQGFAPRAVDIVCKFLKARGVRRAVIRVHPDNASSQRVPAKCGFAETETITTLDGPLVVFAKDL